MGRRIDSPIANPQNYHPLVGLRNIGNFVKGKVTEKGETVNKNPVITLELIDLEGSTSKSVSKGVYAEVEVGVGDLVQLVGNLKDLKDKFPSIQLGDYVLIKYEKDIPTKRGRAMKGFAIDVFDTKEELEAA